MGRRRTIPVTTVGQFWNGLTADYGVAGSYGEAIETLITRLSAARAGYLDNLNNAQLLNIPDLSTLTAARIAYLDNIDSSILDLFYEHFATTIDDDAGLTAGGDVTSPANMIDNDITTQSLWDAVNEYLELTFSGAVYIRQIRVHGHADADGSARAKLQAYLFGTWTDVLLAIAGPATAVWGSWTNLTTPSVATRWRFILTTDDGGTNKDYTELELRGVSVG